jgi:hypothetical protein
MALPAIYRPTVTTNLLDVCLTVDDWACNSIDSDDTRWWMTNLDGWWGPPAPRLAGQDRPQDHGEYDAPSWYGPRIITVTGETTAVSRTAAMHARTIMASVCASDPSQLYRLTVSEPGEPTRQAMVRLADATKISPVVGAWFKWQLALKSPDPRRYDAAESVLPLYPPTGALGGITVPLTVPLTISTTGMSTSAATATNAGTVATRPTATFAGPLVDPQIAHLGKGRSLSLTATLAAGDVLVADFDRRTLLLNGSASRSSTLTDSAAWWELDPGGNDLAFTAGGGDGSATVRWRSAVL